MIQVLLEKKFPPEFYEPVIQDSDGDYISLLNKMKPNLIDEHGLNMDLENLEFQQIPVSQIDINQNIIVFFQFKNDRGIYFPNSDYGYSKAQNHIKELEKTFKGGRYTITVWKDMLSVQSVTTGCYLHYNSKCYWCYDYHTTHLLSTDIIDNATAAYLISPSVDEEYIKQKRENRKENKYGDIERYRQLANQTDDNLTSYDKSGYMLPTDKYHRILDNIKGYGRYRKDIQKLLDMYILIDPFPATFEFDEENRLKCISRRFNGNNDSNESFSLQFESFLNRIVTMMGYTSTEHFGNWFRPIYKYYMSLCQKYLQRETNA